MWFSLDVSYWLTLLLCIPTAFFVVRLFLIQHDCGHGAYFRSAWANNYLGRLIGILTATPYDYWRDTHATHHATTGHLEKRGDGDINTMTVKEFDSASKWRKALYWLYRHPVVMFGIGPMYVFLIKQRLPLDFPFARKKRVWLNLFATNIAIIGISTALAMTIGLPEFLMVQLPVMILAATIGVWMFYVQHQFEDAYWSRGKAWAFYQAALEGSSHYDLPKPLQWLTASIGLHHIHHLNSKIPNYRLQECLDSLPKLEKVTRINFWQSIKCVSFTLWDEERTKMISFRQLRKFKKHRS